MKLFGKDELTYNNVVVYDKNNLTKLSQLENDLGELAGPPGPQGPQGLSAYQIAVNNGFSGTEQEWLDSLNNNQLLTQLQSLIEVHTTKIAQLEQSIANYDYLSNKLSQAITRIEALEELWGIEPPVQEDMPVVDMFLVDTMVVGDNSTDEVTDQAIVDTFAVDTMAVGDDSVDNIPTQPIIDTFNVDTMTVGKNATVLSAKNTFTADIKK